MRRLLYITDQQEYSENGTISSLFDVYLKKYWEVHIVYLTKYKHSFAQKGTHYIVPSNKQDDIIEYLIAKEVDISSYNFIFIRNKKNILQNVIENKKKYGYKIAFRISYPIKHHQLEFEKTFFPYSCIKKIIYKNKIIQRDSLANKCDLFLPPSVQAKEVFYSNINVESFPIFTGLDPDELNTHLISDSKIKKFIYVGSLDNIREFDVILDAFDAIKTEPWELTISTTNKTYITKLLKNYINIKDKVSLVSAMSLKILREQVNENDLGIALMPRNKFYDTVIPDKVVDYYTCSLPSLLTNNDKNHSIFDNDEAYFCDFDKDSIREKLLSLIHTSNKDLAITGNNGQKKLLTLKRNYKILALTLAQKLDSIIDS